MGTPLSGIRLSFTDDSSTPWFQTSLKDVPEEDVEELSDDIDPSREIREITARTSTVGNAICALNFSDAEGETILEIEWENFDLGRETKSFPVPAGHEIIGVQANCVNEDKNISRIGFVLRKRGSN